MDGLIELVGKRHWIGRMSALCRAAACGGQVGRALQQRHALEFCLERVRRSGGETRTSGERAVTELADAFGPASAAMSALARDRFVVWLRGSLDGDNTIVPALHLIRTSALHQARGFDVRFAKFEDEATFDLLLARGGVEAEVVCDVLSAEEGRDVHRGAWVRLVDAIDPDLQTWLADHPGRYVLKLTLPRGLRTDADGTEQLAALHARISAMLSGHRRADHDEGAVMRLDPLVIAAAQADELGLISSLRREFGHEAHLAVTSSGGGVFVLAARAGRENEVAAALRRRMAALAPARLTGSRPGILGMFVEDTDRAEWRHLREQLELEGEARQFLTLPEARPVVAVSCASRFELLGTPAPDGAPDGELRFRNPSHPAAKVPALAPSILSSL